MPTFYLEIVSQIALTTPTQIIQHGDAYKFVQKIH